MTNDELRNSCVLVRAAEVPEPLRRAYLAALTEPQELYVEQLVRAAEIVLIQDRDGGRLLGYSAVNARTVVELFVVDDVSPTSAFDLITAAVRVERVLCKTFDAQLLAAIAGRTALVGSAGFLFRRLDEDRLARVTPIAGQPGVDADVAEILAMHDDFFDSVDEIMQYISECGLFVYRAADGDLLGCGVMRRVVAGLDGIDVGMVVARPHRRRGLGTRIVADLAVRCRTADARPICGCAAENIGSRRALEGAGFCASHALLELRCID